jgi:hypothetical protein
MIVPYPFNTLVYVYGEPIKIPRDASAEDMETYRLQVEQAMMTCVETSDRETGTSS